MTDINYKLDEAAEAITNAYYLSIQEQIGQDDGGVASIFENGQFKNAIARPIVAQLVGSDHSDENFEKVERIFDYEFITSQIEKKWDCPSAVNLYNGEDLKTLAKTATETINKAIQREFPDYLGISSDLEKAINEVTRSYVETEMSYDEPEDDLTSAGPGM